MNARAPRILADQQAERRLAAQRLLTTPCAPEDDDRPVFRRRPAPSSTDALTAAGFAIFKADARDTLIGWNAKAKRTETKDEAFARRWAEMPPLNRERYCRMAAAARSAH